MPAYSVPYSQVSTPPTPAFPSRFTTPRPALPIVLSSGQLSWNCYAVIDSGADDCVFPLNFAARLGLNIASTNRIYSFGGVGSANQLAWFFEVTLSIPGTLLTFQASVGFTPSLDQAGFGLLGQNGFFDRFKVAFDLRAGLFYIEDY